MVKSILAVLVLSLVTFTACTTIPYAREVKKKPLSGGTIALRTYHGPEDRAKADSMMQLNCGQNPVKVLEEGEVVVGEKKHTSAESRPSTSLFSFGNAQDANNGTSTYASTETTQVKEWQISYECIAKAGDKTNNVGKK